MREVLGIELVLRNKIPFGDDHEDRERDLHYGEGRDDVLPAGVRAKTAKCEPSWRMEKWMRGCPALYCDCGRLLCTDFYFAGQFQRVER